MSQDVVYKTARVHMRTLAKGTWIRVKTRADTLKIFVAEPWSGNVTLWGEKYFGGGKNLILEGLSFAPGGGVPPPERLVIEVGMDLVFIDPQVKLFKSG